MGYRCKERGEVGGKSKLPSQVPHLSLVARACLGGISICSVSPSKAIPLSCFQATMDLKH